MGGAGRTVPHDAGTHKSSHEDTHTAPTQSGFGYAVFGKVVSGLDVINIVGAVPTGVTNGMSDVPTTEVSINSMKRIK
mgnify:CR=1 FL=1